MTTNTDRIEKKIELRASQARVWRAISDAKEFGAWFGLELDAPFTPGAQLTGKITPTKADPAIAKSQEPYVGKSVELRVERIEPMRVVSFRWHPYAIDPSIDYSKEPMTLVVFELEETSNGTRLTITESGFDQIPLARRAEAFAMNEGGWTAQTDLIQKYLALSA